MVGLAPSAAASQALADDLGVACENTAKWLHEYDHGRTELRRGQLMIVDEATLADTVTLDRLTGIAAGAGAKVLLVGDPHQLQSVDAGGAFALLVDRRADAPELVEIHRFTNEWEKDASLALSRGDVQAISAYGRHKRIREGVTDEMVDAAYVAWRADCAAGRASILVTESARDVRALNERARAERLLLDGAVDQHEVDLVDGCRASVGDIVITRQNDRRIRTMRGGWVKNGDRWKVTDIRRDGTVVVKRLGPGRGGRTVLPAEYVAEHVDLGYAVTAHRAQGITVDTAHVVVTSSTTRENLYVSMTRGRDSNIAYVALDQPDDSHSTPEADDVTARTVLYGVLQHSGADLSATQTIEAEYELHGGIDRLAAELETIAAEAQHDRFADLLGRSGLTSEQHAAVVESAAFGPLTAALRRAEAYHHDLERLVASSRRPPRSGRRRRHRRGAALPRRQARRESAARLPAQATPHRRSDPGAARRDVRRGPTGDRRTQGVDRVPRSDARRKCCRKPGGLDPSPWPHAVRARCAHPLARRCGDRRRLPRPVQGHFGSAGRRRGVERGAGGRPAQRASRPEVEFRGSGIETAEQPVVRADGFSDNRDPVEVDVSVLAAGLWEQQAGVACGQIESVAPGGAGLTADRIVRTPFGSTHCTKN